MAAAVMPDGYADQIVRGDTRTRREVMQAVCDRIANGEFSEDAAKQEGLTAKAIRGWALASDELGTMYARAREEWTMAQSEAMLRIADEQVVTSEEVARNRLRVDTRKFLIAKVAPKLWGEKTQAEVSITASVLHLDALKATAAVQAQALQNAEVARISVNAVPQLQAPQEDTKVGSDIED